MNYYNKPSKSSKYGVKRRLKKAKEELDVKQLGKLFHELVKTC